MTETETGQDGLFNSVLQALSRPAFDAVVDYGVRDVEAFVRLDPSRLTNVSPRVASEIAAAQLVLRRWPSCEHRPSDHNPLYVQEVQEHSPDMETEREPSALIQDDEFVYRAVLDTLSTRARNVLIYNHIGNLTRLLALELRVLSSFSCCGAKTTAEICEALRRVQNIISTCAAEGKTPTYPQVCQYLSVIRGDAKLREYSAPAIPLQSEPRHRDRTPLMASSRSIDDPEPWSVLRKTIQDMFSLDECSKAALWTAAEKESLASVVSISEADWGKLAAVAIYKDDLIDVLLPATFGYLIELSIGSLFDKLLSSTTAWIEANGIANCVGLGYAASDQQVVSDAEIASIRNLRMESFDVPEELLQVLADRKLLTWGDLTSLTENGILETSGLCFDAVSQIRAAWRIKLYAQQANKRISVGLPNECFVNFEVMMDAYTNVIEKTPREKIVLLGRMGLLEDRKWTLEELGGLLGLTRERIRQIEVKRFKDLKSPHKISKLAKFWMAVEETLRVAGGVCLLGEMSEQVAAKLGWDQWPSEEAFVSVLGLLEHIAISKETGLVLDSNHRCVKCKTIISTMEAIFAEDKSERQLVDVAQHLLSVCTQTTDCAKFCLNLSLSQGFVHFVAGKTAHVLVQEGVVYCRDTWGARRGSRIQLVERILRDAGRPMHFSEVYEQAMVLLPDDMLITEHNVYSWIGNSRNLLLWDRGTYIHCALVKIPGELIAKIECWLEHKLESGVPFVSVAGAYAAFGDELGVAGIPSESALYSCLRQSRNDALSYPRYPYVVLNRLDSERLPVVIALEQYVFEAGGQVSCQELKSYAVDDLCIGEQMFAIHICNVPNIVLAGKGLYIHIENLKLEHNKLPAISAYAASLFSDGGHVSVDKVFSDKQISCLSMGVDSPQMLYSVLQIYASDIIQTPGYPQLLSSNCESADVGKTGVINDVADYVALKQSPCSFDELEQHFVDELGYKIGTVCNVIIRKNVVRYSRGSVVHLDTIEWSDEKQDQLESLARFALVSARAAGRCYALTGHLLEYHELPYLASGVDWTQTLLLELLAWTGRFEVLGSARNAYVAIPNDEGIEEFADLVYELLKSDYEGAYELESFGQDMREAGIVQKQVTPGMLGDQNKVCISNHLILLRELRDHA